MKFRMVDRILAWEPRTRIRGIKTVSFEEYNCKAAFGGDACLPESLLIESLFQLGNWLIMLSSDFTQMGLVVRIERDPLRGAGCGRVRAFDWRLRRRPIAAMACLFDGRALCGERIVGVGTRVPGHAGRRWRITATRMT